MNSNSLTGASPSRLQYCRFAIDETPVCVWSFEPDRVNTDYLGSMDPHYFMNIAEHLAREGFDSSESQQRALAIRSLYGQASESLLALLGATVQAHDCVPGWMGRYRSEELRSVLTKVSQGKCLRNRWGLAALTWETISEIIHAPVSFGGPERKSSYTRAFGGFWRRLAGEHLEPHVGDEYNAIKHGLRSRSGGFSIAIGHEDIPGVRCPPEKMGPSRGSRFGSSTHAPLRIDGTKRHFRFSHVANNWDPKVLTLRIGLISLSMQNVVGRLRQLAGEPHESIRFAWPEEPKAFDDAWPGRPWPFTSSFGDRIDASHISNLSDEQILSVYDAPGTAGESAPKRDDPPKQDGGGSD
jgi:hypothetical protein